MVKHTAIIREANSRHGRQSLLGVRISRRGICRAVGVRLTWLLHCMVGRFAAGPEHGHVQLPVSPTDVVLRQLEADADAKWSFVKKKAHKQWIWIAMAAKTGFQALLAENLR